MGIAIANNAAMRGAEVHLVLGPTSQKVEETYKTTRVTSARQMFETCAIDFNEYNIVIWSAAVADYRPAEVSDTKIKKSDDNISVELIKNIDIAYTLGQKKSENQILVGFALETNDEENNAIKKIHKKNLDFIVLNSLRDSGAGFGHDTNKIKIIHKNGNMVDFGLKSKTEVANDILNETLTIY
jgi:phosphopantothenoylcysteine decarboxylase/phosphopantothenate--cysteine ligase